MTNKSLRDGLVQDLAENTYLSYWYGLEGTIMLCTALQKQIPEKPINQTGYYRDNRCPACNARIKSGAGSSSTYRNNWCNHCGQAIDWNDKNSGGEE